MLGLKRNQVLTVKTVLWKLSVFEQFLVLQQSLLSGTFIVVCSLNL